MHDCGFTDFPTKAFVEGCVYLFWGCQVSTGI